MTQKNIYIAHYTDNKTKRRIQLTVVADDYNVGLCIARKLTETKEYRFDDLIFSKKAPKQTKVN